MTRRLNEYKPDWVSPPGETISELLEEARWTTENLASELGYNIGYLEALLKGILPITEEVATKLSLLWSTKEFWLRREEYYQASLIRLQKERFNTNSRQQ